MDDIIEEIPEESESLSYGSPSSSSSFEVNIPWNILYETQLGRSFAFCTGMTKICN